MNRAIGKNSQVLQILAREIQELISQEEIDMEGLQEIRLRVGSPVILNIRGKERIPKRNGKPHLVTKTEMRETVDYISSYSLYAFEEELRQGFLTVEGGHRIGVCGQVMQLNGRINRIYPILYLNIRIARERKACGALLYKQLWREQEPENTLLLSAPGNGKTTLLRDLIRLFSNGDEAHPGKRIGLVDERSEIAGCLHGIPQNDLGIRTDVLDGCPKVEGMMLLIRSMAPEILAVDEIGGREDFAAMEYAMRCGCHLLATVHAGSLEELFQKPGWDKCGQVKLFRNYVVISKENGERRYTVYDERGTSMRC